MKIRVRDHVKVDGRQDGQDRAGHDRARPARPLLRGARASRRSPTPTTTRTRSTTCSRAPAASRWAAPRSGWRPGEALVAAAGVEHGLVNDGADPLLVLVVVAPPPPPRTRPEARGRARARRDHDHLPRRLFFPEVGRGDGAAPAAPRRDGGVSRRGRPAAGCRSSTRAITTRRRAWPRARCELFEGAEHVVVPSGSCAWMVKTEYPGLLKHDPALAGRGRGRWPRARASSRSSSWRCSA